MAMTRWEPFNELMPLREMMNRLMEESFIMPRWYGSTREMMASFPIDVSESENEFIVKAAMPGVKPDDIDVRIADNTLTIKGEYKEELEEGQRAQGQMAARQVGQTGGRPQEQPGEPRRPTYHKRELSSGTLYREITLPTPVQADKAQASYENGVLQLVLPKAEEAKPKRIPIQGHTTGQGQPRIKQG